MSINKDCPECGGDINYRIVVTTIPPKFRCSRCRKTFRKEEILAYKRSKITKPSVGKPKEKNMYDVEDTKIKVWIPEMPTKGDMLFVGEETYYYDCKIYEKSRVTLLFWDEEEEEPLHVIWRTKS